MTLWLADKRDLRSEMRLPADTEAALRDTVTERGGVACRDMALAVLERCRRDGLWLACDCCGEIGDRPYLAPCQRGDSMCWTRLSRGRRLHDDECDFARIRRLESDADKQRWNRKARTEPSGFFSLRLDDPAARRVAATDGRPGKGNRGRGSRPPALSQLLSKVMARAGLNRIVAGATKRPARDWLKDIQEVAAGELIAPGRPLSDLWFPYPRMWDREAVHARLRRAARDWPAKHMPQAFLSWPVREADDHGVETWVGGTRVDVVDGLRRPVIEGTPVSGPWLFLGVVGLHYPTRGYECRKGWAQPIVSLDWPIPVDSHVERLAFLALSDTLTDLLCNFPDARFALEKPVFELSTPDGPCIPDFVVTAERGGDIVRFIIEVMGFDRPDYLKGKEETHERMAGLGILLTMDATRFGEGSHRVRAEGRAVTRTVNGILRGRWRRG